MGSALYFKPAVFAAATDGSASAFDVVSVMEQSVNSVQSQLLRVMAITVPAIVVVVGASVAVAFGIRWIKRMKGA